ncbi:hypothetical protein BV898_12527 [Hypsibius exemplaris]|uniref:Uncharacterized protein n=1 Tax=Hypsibius exemplaris TaxID=2072580 RepID=A0A1W0WDJ6_HYPEX|nr:hypothetical protein BV898_12527 [Hypsibius exemplaris]
MDFNHFSMPLEQFLKNVLDLRRSTPTDALLCLTGRVPQSHRHSLLHVKFIIRAPRRKSGLMFAAMQLAIDNAKLRKRSWFRSAMQPWADIMEQDWTEDSTCWTAVLTGELPSALNRKKDMKFWMNHSDRIQANISENGRRRTNNIECAPAISCRSGKKKPKLHDADQVVE